MFPYTYMYTHFSFPTIPSSLLLSIWQMIFKQLSHSSVLVSSNLIQAWRPQKFNNRQVKDSDLGKLKMVPGASN